MTLPRKILLLAIIGLAIGLTIGFFSSSLPKHTNATIGAASLPSGGDFTLQSSTGEIKLSDYRGKLVLVYFGYTYCPDICPTSLAFMSGAFNTLTPDELAQAQGIFVSVDPARDTVDKLQQYTHYFHPNILGVTGTKDTIDDIVKRYGASYRIVDTGSAAGYSVDHSSSTALVGKDGKIKTFLRHGMTSDELAQAIRAHL